MSNLRTTSYDLYRNRADGRFWAILRSTPNSYIYTVSSYVSPALALSRLVNRQNSSLTARANKAEINHWVATAGVNRVSTNTVRSIIQANSNLYNRIVAAGLLTFGPPNKPQYRR